MLMTTLVMNQKQNKFQFWKSTDERCCEGNTSESDVSDLEQQKNNDGSLQGSDENTSGQISGP